MKYNKIGLGSLAFVLCLTLTFAFKVPKKVGRFFKHSSRPFAQHEKSWSRARLYDEVERFQIWQRLSARYPVIEKKPLVVVIASYNNEGVCERNLQSIFDQTYDNYRVIYVDDCSKDQTYERVKAYVKARGMENRCTLIRNPVRKLKLPNLYRSYLSCRDDEIIVSVDGDDWLAHERVLERINQVYQNPDIWLTYGSSITHPNYERSVGAPLTDTQLRSGKIRKRGRFELSMLRTFYAGLFKQIHLKDLFYQGSFLPTADDVGFMVPMVEMAPEHSLFIPEILYVINENNPIRHVTVMGNLEEAVANYIMDKEKYKPLPKTFNPRDTETPVLKEPLDLLVVSEDNPLLLEVSLTSYQKKLSPLKSTTVFFKASTVEYKKAYLQLAQIFPESTFIQDDSCSIYTIGELMTTHKETQPYIALTTDNFIFPEDFSLETCVRKMESTHAADFFIGHSSQKCAPIPLCDHEGTAVMDSLNILKIKDLRSDSFFLILRKTNLLKTLSNRAFREKGFLPTYLNIGTGEEDLHLFFETNKSYLLQPQKYCAALTKDSLLKKFQEGYTVSWSSLEEHIAQGLSQEDFVQKPLLHTCSN